jgi:hypothetical protein
MREPGSKHGNDGETRILRSKSQAEADVLEQLFKPNEGPDHSRFFLHSRYVAELTVSGVARSSG